MPIPPLSPLESSQKISVEFIDICDLVGVMSVGSFMYKILKKEQAMTHVFYVSHAAL
jgi:hypothetical protein